MCGDHAAVRRPCRLLSRYADTVQHTDGNCDQYADEHSNAYPHRDGYKYTDLYAD
jgi:hypothetical protein